MKCFDFAWLLEITIAMMDADDQSKTLQNMQTN